MLSMPVRPPIKLVGLVAMSASPELGVEHEAARVHNASQRRDGHLAAHRTRTAAAESANHRVLGAGTSSVSSQWTAAFVQRLRGLGWSKAATLQSIIALPRDARNGIAKSRPSSLGSRSTSLLQRSFRNNAGNH